MKGLYCKVGETAAEAKFVIQETVSAQHNNVAVTLV